MSYKSYKKPLFFFIIAILLLSGVYFTLGGFGRSGPDAAPNLAEYGLVGYWNMEEGKGQTVYDRSGNGNNGTLGASTSVGKDDPVFTSGYSSAGAGGTALKFDGVDDYLQLGGDDSFKSLTSGTISGWFTVSSLSAVHTIFGLGPKTTNSYGLFFRLQTTTTGQLRILQRNSDSSTSHLAAATAASTIGTNIFYHFAYTVDANGNSLYINGTKQTLTYTVGSSTTNIFFDDVATTQNYWLGTYKYLAALSYFHNGSIDEVRIYNRALSADEIRQHYNQKKPILEWKFDEGSGTTTRDESFNNNDGTLHE